MENYRNIREAISDPATFLLPDNANALGMVVKADKSSLTMASRLTEHNQAAAIKREDALLK